MSLHHSMSIKVLGAYINTENNTEDNAEKILSVDLDELVFDNNTHKMIVRAINNLKKSGAIICDLNLLEYLERYGVPRNTKESAEIIEVLSEFGITSQTFNSYYETLKKEAIRKVAMI